MLGANGANRKKVCTYVGGSSIITIARVGLLFWLQLWLLSKICWTELVRFGGSASGSNNHQSIKNLSSFYCCILVLLLSCFLFPVHRCDVILLFSTFTNVGFFSHWSHHSNLDWLSFWLTLGGLLSFNISAVFYTLKNIDEICPFSHQDYWSTDQRNYPGHADALFHLFSYFSCQLVDQALSDWPQVNREAIQLGSEVICWVSATRWLELAELIHEGEGEHAEGCDWLTDEIPVRQTDIYISPISIHE